MAIPTALYTGTIRVGTLELTVHVLDDGRRIISEEDTMRFFRWLADDPPFVDIEDLRRQFKETLS